MENIKEIRVSAKTNVKMLASSIIYSLEEGLTVKAISIGEAIRTLTFAIALINTAEEKTYDIDINLKIEYVKTNTGIKDAIVWYLKKKEN